MENDPLSPGFSPASLVKAGATLAKQPKPPASGQPQRGRLLPAVNAPAPPGGPGSAQTVAQAGTEQSGAPAEAASGGGLERGISVGRTGSHWTASEHLADVETGEEVSDVQQWSFACIMAPATLADIPEGHRTRKMNFRTFVLSMCARFSHNGLEVALVPRSETSQHKTVLLLRCPEEELHEEFRRLAISRWKESGEGLEFELEHAAGGGRPTVTPVFSANGVPTPTAADRIHLMAMLISRPKLGVGGSGQCPSAASRQHSWTQGAVECEGCGEVAAMRCEHCDATRKLCQECTDAWGLHDLGNLEHREEDPDHDPRLVAIFPLHNDDWTRQMTEQFFVHFSLKGRCQRVWKSCCCCRRRSQVQVSPCQEAPEPAQENDDVNDGDDGDDGDAGGARGSGRGRHLPKLRVPHLHVKESLDAMKESMGAVKSNAVDLAHYFAEAPDTTFLDQINQQHGERFAFLFAFCGANMEAMTVLIWLMAAVEIVGTILGVEYAHYLRTTGIVGLLIPVVWGPFALGYWDRKARGHAQRWGAVGVTELPERSPFYQRHLFPGMRKRLVAVYSILAVVVACVAMFLMTMMILELEVLTQTTPLCDSWFYVNVWKDYIASSGKYAGSSYGLAKLAVVECYPEISDTFGWRGLGMLIVALIEGILIGLVYSEVFTCFALNLARLKNKIYWHDHERNVVNFTYPFEAGATMFYFLVLAFVFVPNTASIQASLAANDQPLILEFNSTAAVPSHLPSPCRTFGDGVCDEWRGACVPGSDARDCAGWGCTDPAAMNFHPNASKSLGYSPLPHSFVSSAVPNGLKCRYSAELDGSNRTTTCATAGDGTCDEALSCFFVAMSQHSTVAVAALEKCVGATPSATCWFGSDTADCRAGMAELLNSSCSSSSSSTAGCLALLGSSHFRRNSQASPVDVCRGLLASHDPVCNTLPVVWPPHSATSTGPMASVTLDALIETVQCDTLAAYECTDHCDQCAACLLNITGSGNSTRFCSEYALCVRCTNRCSRYAECFSDATKLRAGSGTACARMGRVKDNWCDEAGAMPSCGYSAGSASWSCPTGEDHDDCSTEVCNVGCMASARKHHGSACETARVNITTTVEAMMEVWMYDKRFKNQIGDMVLLPMIFGFVVPMLFEWILPKLCTGYWRDTRRKTPRQGICARCCRCCCCRSILCRIMWSYFMCDEDSFAGGNAATRVKAPALDIDDETLAKEIWETRTKSFSKRRRQSEASDSPRIDAGGGWRSILHESRDSKSKGLNGEADAIIIESMLEKLDMPNEYRKICIVILFVMMWSVVMPWLALIGYVVLMLRFKFNFVKLTHYNRRPIPRKPATTDPTGGYHPWLTAQMIFSALVVAALFCFSTGQLEAWWALYDATACSPPSLEVTHWRYPSCDVGFITESTATESSEVYDSPSAIMGSNDTCWEDTSEVVAPACPFAGSPQGDSSNARGWSFRLAAFIVIQNIQALVCIAAKYWNDSQEDGSQKEWARNRIKQHKLVAESVFPTTALERVQQQTRAIQERTAFLDLVKARASSPDGHQAKVSKTLA